MLWIQTQANFAELVLVKVVAFAAAVTLIPPTTAIVVFIVTDTVFGKIRKTALSGALLFLGVQAFTFVAKFIIIFLAAAIAFVPIARAVVVIVITGFVTNPIGFLTSAGCFGAVFDFIFSVTIFALAFFTVRFFF